MRVLVVPHQMTMGGSQINAIELAGAVRDLGHEVILFAPHGLLDPLVEGFGLRRIVKPSVADFSISSLRRLSDVVRRERIDLVHAYEWGPSIESTIGAHLRWGVPVLMTVLSMDVPGFLPHHLPITVGTEELRDQQLIDRRLVYLTEPPIDTTANCSRDRWVARDSFGFADCDVVIATVCRMTSDLDKLAGTLVAVEVVGALAGSAPVKLLVVGDGPGLGEVKLRAEEVNVRHGAQVITVVGPMLDPRPAYDCADIMVGMGSSALKSLAFSKPLVVQGEIGFWKLLTPDSIGQFLRQGWFGHGGAGAPDLMSALEPIVANAGRRTELGQFGHDVVTQRFSLDTIAQELVSTYEQVMSTPPERNVPALIAAGLKTLKFAAHRRFRARLVPRGVRE